MGKKQTGARQSKADTRSEGQVAQVSVQFLFFFLTEMQMQTPPMSARAE